MKILWRPIPTNLLLLTGRSSMLYLSKFKQPLQHSLVVYTVKLSPRFQFAGDQSRHHHHQKSVGFQRLGLPRHQTDFPTLLLKHCGLVIPLGVYEYGISKRPLFVNGFGKGLTGGLLLVNHRMLEDCRCLMASSSSNRLLIFHGHLRVLYWL